MPWKHIGSAASVASPSEMVVYPCWPPLMSVHKDLVQHVDPFAVFESIVSRSIGQILAFRYLFGSFGLQPPMYVS